MKKNVEEILLDNDFTLIDEDELLRFLLKICKENQKLLFLFEHLYLEYCSSFECEQLINFLKNYIDEFKSSKMMLVLNCLSRRVVKPRIPAKISDNHQNRYYRINFPKREKKDDDLDLPDLEQQQQQQQEKKEESNEELNAPETHEEEKKEDYFGLPVEEDNQTPQQQQQEEEKKESDDEFKLPEEDDDLQLPETHEEEKKENNDNDEALPAENETNKLEEKQQVDSVTAFMTGGDDDEAAPPVEEPKEEAVSQPEKTSNPPESEPTAPVETPQPEAQTEAQPVSPESKNLVQVPADDDEISQDVIAILNAISDDGDAEEPIDPEKLEAALKAGDDEQNTVVESPESFFDEF